MPAPLPAMKTMHAGVPAGPSGADALHPLVAAQFDWRNGWFYEQSKQAMEAGTFDPYPRHTEALKEVGAI
jgi:hypothetical protein